jgi:hypothetical protein
MMRTFALGEELSSRTLRFRTRSGNVLNVTVVLGKPVADLEPPERAWICPFQIVGIRDEPVRAMFGVDAFQALVLALHVIPTELRSIARDESGSFPDADEDLGLTHACRVHLAP